MNINLTKRMAMAGAAALMVVAASTGAVEQDLITVMNPVVESKMAVRAPLSPRLDTLEGKTLYMVDINWGGPQAAYSVFQQMQAWFAEHMPSVKTEIRRLRGSYMSDDPALWKEIKEKGDAAIVGISG